MQVRLLLLALRVAHAPGNTVHQALIQVVGALGHAAYQLGTIQSTVVARGDGRLCIVRHDTLHTIGALTNALALLVQELALIDACALVIDYLFIGLRTCALL